MEIQFSPELLAEYNETSGTEYEVLPENMLPKNATVTIPAGEISASYRLHVDDFVTNGITYAIPLTLGNVLKGDIPKSKVQSRFIYVLAKPLNVSVPVLRGNAGNVTTLPETDWGITVPTVRPQLKSSAMPYYRKNSRLSPLRGISTTTSASPSPCSVWTKPPNSVS